MKRTGKFLVALLAVVILLTSMTVLTASAAKTTEPTTIYLTPSAYWKQSNARFALYTWDGGDKWFNMTDADGDGVYECEIPAGIENIIFCRMNPSTTANNWNNKWNQTADLKYNGSSNHYTVKEGTWDKGGGTWSTFASSCTHANLGPAATCTTPQECLECGDPIVSALGHSYNSTHFCTRCNTQASFTVAGSGKHLGTEWDTGNTANDMTFADGVYTKVYENVAAGSYKFKVVRDHDWGTAYPGQDKSYTVATSGSMVVITFNGSAVDVTVSAPHVCEYTEPATCLKGQHCKCGLVDPENSELGAHVFEGGICSVCGQLNLEDTVTIYFENNWGWPVVRFFYWYGENNNAAWPGVNLETPVAKSEAGHDIYKIEVPVGIDGFIFSGVGQYGEEQCNDVKEFGDCDCYSMTYVADDNKPAVANKYHAWTGATCETPAVCSVCQAEGEALGHDMIVDKAVAPTCEDKGLTEGSHCSRCDHVVAQEEVDALGHDMIVDKAVAPTCEDKGLTEGSHCSRCDHKVAQEEVDALGHVWGGWIVDKEATEEEDGEQHRVCDTCGDVETGIIPSIAHTHNYTSEVTTAPTCEAEGVKTFSCVCGDTYTEAVAALGHDLVVDKAVAPTCTTAGLTEGSHCSRCDYKVAQEEVPALGHEFDTYKSLCSVCYAPNPDFIVNTIDVTKENKLICNKYHLVGDLGPYEFLTVKIENAGHYKFVGTGLAFTIYTISADAPGADFTTGTGASWAQYVFTEADLEPGTYWVGIVFLAGEGEYTVTVEYTAPHSHNFVDGKCECGEEDPNYVPPHEHEFVNGKCECGEEDPNYVAPEQPGEDKPGEDKPEPQPEQPGFFQRIWKAIVDFFKSIIAKVSSLLPKK